MDDILTLVDPSGCVFSERNDFCYWKASHYKNLYCVPLQSYSLFTCWISVSAARCVILFCYNTLHKSTHLGIPWNEPFTIGEYLASIHIPISACWGQSLATLSNEAIQYTTWKLIVWASAIRFSKWQRWRFGTAKKLMRSHTSSESKIPSATDTPNIVQFWEGHIRWTDMDYCYILCRTKYSIIQISIIHCFLCVGGVSDNGLIRCRQMASITFSSMNTHRPL